MIWETDNKLQSKDGTTKTESRFKVLVRGKDPFLITRVGEPLAVETNFCEDGLRDETCLESNIISRSGYSTINRDIDLQI